VTASIARDAVRGGGRLPLLRWALLGVLLAVEALFLCTAYDAQPLLAGGQWWAGLLGHAGIVVPLATSVAAAVLLVGSAWVWDLLPDALDVLRPARRWWPFLAGHLVAFALFAWLTAVLFGGGFAARAYPGLWIAAWAAVGAATLALWGEALVPASLVVAMVRRAPAVLFAGAAVGAGAWLAGQVTDSWWSSLGAMTFWVVHGLLRWVMPELVAIPGEYVVGSPSFLVAVRPPCSGYQGIGLIWVFVLGYLWLFRRTLRFPQAFVLLPIGTVVVWVANALRIAALVAMGTWVSPEVAVGGFHHNAGALLFCGVALGMVAVARRWRFIAAAPATEASGGNATAAHLAPLLAIVATAGVTAAFSAGGFDLLYPARVLVAAAVLFAFRRAYRELRWTWSWVAAAAGAVGFVLWLVLAPRPADLATATASWQAGLAGLPGAAGALWLALRIAGAVITVPLAEELAFRGYLTRRLVAADFEHVPAGTFTWLSFLVSSALFGAMHDAWVAGTLVGMLYALTWYRRGELADAVLAHAVTNALLATYVLTTGAWWLWG